MSAAGDNDRRRTEWPRERLEAFWKARLDDIEKMHEPYGELRIELRYEKGKVVLVAEERRLTHK